jgi:hypothetical protein
MAEKTSLELQAGTQIRTETYTTQVNLREETNTLCLETHIGKKVPTNHTSD